MSSSKPPAKEKLTAEERLFKAIENGGVTLEKGPPERRGPGLSESLSKFFGSLRGLTVMRPRPVVARASSSAAAAGFGLASVNRILMGLIALGLAGTVANSFLFKPDINRVYDRVAQANVPSAAPAPLPSRRPVDEYLAPLAQRSLFHSDAKPPAPVPTTALTPAPLPAANVEETIGNMQLVGIAWGAYPEAMIRDKKEGRTHFIKQGQTFKDVLVKEIQKDRVIVEYGGTQKELM